MQFFRLFGIAPLGIGVTLLIALWMPNSPFRSAPVFFKIFGSFIAFSFVLFGGAFVFGNFLPENRLRSMMSHLKELQGEQGTDTETSRRPPVSEYQCSSCGATLDQSADVSPHGDVKCEHCGKWFNIHKS